MRLHHPNRSFSRRTDSHLLGTFLLVLQRSLTIRCWAHMTSLISSDSVSICWSSFLMRTKMPNRCTVTSLIDQTCSWIFSNSQSLGHGKAHQLEHIASGPANTAIKVSRRCHSGLMSRRQNTRHIFENAQEQTSRFPADLSAHYCWNIR
jgi:hypothetical protein